MEDPVLPSSPRKKLKMDTGSVSTSARDPFSTDRKIPSTQESPDIQLSKEEEVGITEFVSPDLPGFNGILKKRYTDFLVNEILLSGQVVHLDNLKAPKIGRKAEQSTQTETTSTGIEEKPKYESQGPPEPVTPEHISPDSNSQNPTTTATNSSVQPDVTDSDALQKWQSYASKPDDVQLTSVDAALLNSFFDKKVVASILALYNRILNSPHRKPKEYGIVKSDRIPDRELRTQIHQAVRRIFSARLDSYTDNDGAMVISAAVGVSKWGTRASGGRNNGGQQLSRKGMPGWKELGGEYLHFTLLKENKDTMEIISYLARQLKVKPQSFQFAGTKDRRAVTVQRVSIYRMHAERMSLLNRSLRNAKIGNYEYSPHGLELGELSGNEFLITLRQCEFQDLDKIEKKHRLSEASKIVRSAAQCLSERGFINYYGLQRFGTFKTRTDSVGVKMIQGDFKGAVEAILDYSQASLSAAHDPLSTNDLVSSDDKCRAVAIDAFKSTGKSHPALDGLPRKFSAEACLIRHLGGHNQTNDYLGAIQTIPRNLRLMYVHAYQSLVWNMIASERWKRHQDQILTGDLVLINEHKQNPDDDPKIEDVDADGEVIVQPALADSGVKPEDQFIRARALSQEEAESGKYTIFDIVLPTPGYDVLYPANEVADLYKAFMGSDRGGNLDPNNMRRQWKDVSLSGSYRKLVVRPSKAISAEVRIYINDDEQFVETDLDRMQSQAHGSQNVKDDHESRQDADEGEGIDEAAEQVGMKVQPEKMAVILRLQLGSSQYATMALRELMKLGGVKAYKPDFGGGR